MSSAEGTGVGYYDGPDSGTGEWGPYYFGPDEVRNGYGSRPDTRRPEVRDFILGRYANYITESHLDGVRYDAAVFWFDESDPDDPFPQVQYCENYTLAQELTRTMNELDPPGQPPLLFHGEMLE